MFAFPWYIMNHIIPFPTSRRQSVRGTITSYVVCVYYPSCTYSLYIDRRVYVVFLARFPFSIFLSSFPYIPLLWPLLWPARTRSWAWSRVWAMLSVCLLMSTYVKLAIRCSTIAIYAAYLWVVPAVLSGFLLRVDKASRCLSSVRPACVCVCRCHNWSISHEANLYRCCLRLVKTILIKGQEPLSIASQSTSLSHCSCARACHWLSQDAGQPLGGMPICHVHVTPQLK